jgi:hypothetical protein
MVAQHCAPLPERAASREDSFEQVFHGWRAGPRTAFYLCCSAFSVFFLKGRDGAPKAVVTPTTRGLRETLRNEGRISPLLS